MCHTGNIKIISLNNPLNNSKNEIISNLTTKKSLPEILKISLYNNQIINFSDEVLKLPHYNLRSLKNFHLYLL